MVPDVKDEEEDLSPEMVEAMLGKATYKTIYHFEKSVKRSSNKKAVISEDGHTVTLDIPLAILMAGEAKVANKIKLKR